MIKIIMLVCMTVAVIACTSVGITNVQPTTVETSRVINIGYDEAWLRVVDWFAMHNIPIGKIEKESGFINAEYALGVDLTDLSCGEPTGNQGLYTAKFENASGHLNVTIRKLDKDKSRLTVNFSGRVDVVIRNAFGMALQSTTVRCYSKGTIEKNILDSI